jgi:hypothetical protein
VQARANVVTEAHGQAPGTGSFDNT